MLNVTARGLRPVMGASHFSLLFLLLLIQAVGNRISQSDLFTQGFPVHGALWLGVACSLCATRDGGRARGSMHGYHCNYALCNVNVW